MVNKLPEYLTISSDPSIDLASEIKRLNPDQIAILVDENTRKHCLPQIDIEAKVIEIQAGEEHKTLKTCETIWQQLTDGGFSRKSLLINLGGGVIGDMGGFAAATYKRGIRFINVPTTLLSQVDASIGGKLGIDFGGLKNHLGMFRNPDAVIVSPAFLKTLSPRELKSGFAEIIKHALIYSPEQWAYLKKTNFSEIDWNYLIPNSIAVKQAVVKEDPFENGLRKILNYGHTLGHAIETFYLHSENRLLHGEAIIVGMLLENELATQLELLSRKENEEIADFLKSNYDLTVKIPNLKELEGLLLQDKKNSQQRISFSMLTGIGSCTHDVHLEAEMLQKLLK